MTRAETVIVIATTDVVVLISFGFAVLFFVRRLIDDLNADDQRRES